MKFLKLLTLTALSFVLSGCMFLLSDSGSGMGPAKFFGGNTPKAYKGLTSPIKPNKQNLITGKNLYSNNCLRCHGKTAQGDGPDADNILPRPANLQKTMNRFITVKDDYLFYSISEGKNNQNGMPAFKNTVSEEDRWLIVNYLKTYRK